MNVVLLLWRTRMRSSWRTALVLVALIGLGGGVTLAVAAGARRTASANDAILREANASDVSVPTLLLATAVVATVLVVQGAALVPATLARRTAPGQTLHGE